MKKLFMFSWRRNRSFQTLPWRKMICIDTINKLDSSHNESYSNNCIFKGVYTVQKLKNYTDELADELTEPSCNYIIWQIWCRQLAARPRVRTTGQLAQRWFKSCCDVGILQLLVCMWNQIQYTASACMHLTTACTKFNNCISRLLVSMIIFSKENTTANYTTPTMLPE